MAKRAAAKKRRPAARKKVAAKRRKPAATKRRKAAAKRKTKKAAAGKKAAKRGAAKAAAKKRKPAAKKRAAKRTPRKAAPAKKPSARELGRSVDDYVAGLDGWQRDIVDVLRAIVQKAAPNSSESIKWGQPVYEDAGPFAHIKAFKSHVNVGFWRGIDLPDPSGALTGSGDKMRHIKISSPEELDESVLADFVAKAVRLNRRKGDPTKG